MWNQYFSVSSIPEVLNLLSEYGERARVVAGGTDLIIELERGVRQGIEVLIDVTRVPKLDLIVMDEDEVIHLGPMVTHNHCADSKLIVERAFPLAQAALEVGAPQIRNRGTVAGNLITASPANDTIPPLIALGASVTLASSRGERVVPLSQFYQGVRRTVMEPDEMMVDISFRAMKTTQRGTFLKMGLRRAQAILVANAAVVLDLQNSKIKGTVISLGAVAPTIIRAREAEAYLDGRELDETAIVHAAGLAAQAAQPISDVRGSADYRREMVRISVLRALRLIMKGEERDGYPKQPVLLSTQLRNGKGPRLAEKLIHNAGQPIVTRINGKEYTFTTGQNKTLLRLLREEASLIGTKEGCAEGECGACTVFLDGMAVMSCLVPAARAHGADIVTVEGLTEGDHLNPVQQAFIDAGAVQCGFCTPGFIMAGTKLLEERLQPTREEIYQSITGNLCRCTGYYKIVEAIERASQEVEHGQVRQV